MNIALRHRESVVRQIICLLFALAGVLSAASARAQEIGSCTVSSANADLGSHSSLVVATTAQQGMGSGGLACSSLSLLSTSYIKVRLESSTFVLTGGPANQTIAFSVAPTENDPPLLVGQEFDFTSFQVINLFSGPGGSIPLHFRTTPTAGLRAGTYVGTVNLRWYFSICTLGVGVCIYSESAGFQRPIPVIRPNVNWGTGQPTTVAVTLTVENDCAITAPDLNFGAAPLVSTFNSVTRTITMRCSAGTAYSVGLGNGLNPNGVWRQMRRGTSGDYLRYQIYRDQISSDRWGTGAGERRSSAGADTFPNVYDGETQQGFVYRAIIDPSQPTPAAGTYTDSVVVDVLF